jgi:hypothetical protein
LPKRRCSLGSLERQLSVLAVERRPAGFWIAFGGWMALGSWDGNVLRQALLKMKSHQPIIRHGDRAYNAAGV